MGNKTILHGYIEALESVEYARRNRAGLAALPEWSPQTHPLITRDMFAQPDYGDLRPIIVFGRSYNGVERQWHRWREEFEALLQTLYWYEVQVWVQTAWWGDFQCSWSSSGAGTYLDQEESVEELSKGTPREAPQDEPHDEPLGPTTHWLYRGPERNVVR